MQHLHEELVRAVMAEREREAREQRRADVHARSSRRARLAEARTRPTRLRVLRAVTRASGVA